MGVVPDRRLIRGLEKDPVELAVDGPQVLPHRCVVRTKEVGSGAVELLQAALGGEIVQQAWLGEDGDVRRTVRRDSRAEDGADIVAGRGEGALGTGTVVEGRQDGLEILLLVSGPHGCDLYLFSGQGLVTAAGARPAAGSQQQATDDDHRDNPGLHSFLLRSRSPNYWRLLYASRGLIFNNVIGRTLDRRFPQEYTGRQGRGSFRARLQAIRGQRGRHHGHECPNQGQGVYGPGRSLWMW